MQIHLFSLEMYFVVQLWPLVVQTKFNLVSRIDIISKVFMFNLLGFLYF